MEVLFLSRRFYPQIGGVEKHVYEVGKRLIERGFEVIVITEKTPRLKNIDEIDGIKVIRISVGKDNWFKKFRIWKELFKHLNLIKSTNIVHCHDIFFWYLPFRFVFPFKKVFTTFHGYEGNEIPGRKSIFMHKLAEKLSFGNICVGDFLKKWYGTEPNFVIYGGVDESLIKAGEENIKPEKDILFLGRLEEETGIMKYLEALKMLQQKGKAHSLDVFGDGSLLNKAKKFSKKNNLKVSFNGFIKKPEKYIANYRYILTSRYLGILEAMAVKRPIFAQYNNEIKKDYLEMTPFSKFIYIFKNAEELSDRFSKLRRKNNINAYNWVENQTWHNVCDIYLRLWSIKI